MNKFVGRRRELQRLEDALENVKRSGGGQIISVRGRRQIGKSRLMEEFIKRTKTKAVFYVASQMSAEEELAAFRDAIASSPADTAALATQNELGSWQAALTLLANEATSDHPVVVVLDEFPYLCGSYPPIEGVLQTFWDRTLENKRPLLLILVGSDITMMEQQSTYGRPLFNRVQEHVIEPLSPAEIGEMLNLEAPAALEGYLVLGGFPRLAARWQRGDTIWSFLKRELSDAESSLLVMGERMLAAEFPADLKAQNVIKAIGSGERTFTGIGQRAHVSDQTLLEALRAMEHQKRVIVKGLPYSSVPRRKLSHYSISDPYLRFWLRFVSTQITTVQRGRGDVVLARIKKSWPEYRGRAIEPLIRRGIEHLLPDDRFGEALFVGGYWNRDSSVEVDLVGGSEEAKADPVEFIGSVKWRESGAFGRSDLAALTTQRADVPGTSGETLLIGVSPTGFDVNGLDVELDAEDILRAYAGR